MLLKNSSIYLVSLVPWSMIQVKDNATTVVFSVSFYIIVPPFVWEFSFPITKHKGDQLRKSVLFTKFSCFHRIVRVQPILVPRVSFYRYSKLQEMLFYDFWRSEAKKRPQKRIFSWLDKIIRILVSDWLISLARAGWERNSTARRGGEWDTSERAEKAALELTFVMEAVVYTNCFRFQDWTWGSPII